METEAGLAISAPVPRDAEAELRFLRQRVRALAGSRHSADLEDIASDAWIRLDRTLRREPANNLEALMTHVAWRAWADFCRRRTSETRALGHPVDVHALQLEVPEEERGVDPNALALWRFAVCEWFQRNSPRCLDPARFVFAGRSWTDAAKLLDEKPNSIAKRWQRCREEFLAAVRKDRGDLRQLLDYFEGLAS